MILWWTVHDYTSGLASNLLAEMCGLVASIIVTYLILDRILDRRFKAHNKPLLRRLRDQIDYAVSMMSFSWSMAIGEARHEDAIEAAHGSMVHPVRERLAPSGDSSELLAQMRGHGEQGAL